MCLRQGKSDGGGNARTGEHVSPMKTKRECESQTRGKEIEQLTWMVSAV